MGRKAEFLFPGFLNPFNYYLQGNLAWEIDIWGRIRRSNEAARGDLLAREEARRAVVLQLVSGVAETYFDLLQFDQQLAIARRTLQSWQESVRIAQAQQVESLQSAFRQASLRYKSGLANYLDVLIAQRNLFDAELSLTSTHRLHLVSVVQLYKALGGGWSPLDTAQQMPSHVGKTEKG